MKYRDRAVVLSRRNVNTADWSVTLLTAMHGVRTVLVKGAQRAPHRLNPRLQVGAHVDAEFYNDRLLTHVQPREGLPRHSYVRLITFAVEQLAAEGGREPQLYALVVEALRRKDDPELVFVSFLITALELLGWGISLDHCALCGAAGRHAAFNISAGGSVCNRCRPAGSTLVKPQVIELMCALRNADRIEYDPGTLHQVRALVTAHFQYHLECQLPIR